MYHIKQPTNQDLFAQLTFRGGLGNKIIYTNTK